MPGNAKFGRKIRRLRERKKSEDPTFSLTRFAKQVGVSPTYMSRMERGEFDPPKAEKIITMAKLLGEDVDELLALAGKTNPELEEIIQSEPRAMADLLRAARDCDLSAGDLDRITRNMKKKAKI
jgi:transcriptional regulator with XRE-family HTH domain